MLKNLKPITRRLIIYIPLLILVVDYFFVLPYSERILWDSKSWNLFLIGLYLIGVVIIALFLGRKSVLNWLAGVAYSYLIFNIGFLCIFTAVNYIFSNSEVRKSDTCEVQKFSISTYRNSKVMVDFKGERRKLYIYSKEYLKYQKDFFNGEKTFVEIRYHKGIFGTFIVDDFSFVK